MKKRVEVSIISITDGEKSEKKLTGHTFIKHSDLYLRYEDQEDNRKMVTILKWNKTGQSLHVIRQGYTSASMEFERP